MNTRASKGITKPRVLFSCDTSERADSTDGAQSKNPKSKSKKSVSGAKIKKSSELVTATRNKNRKKYP